MNKFLYKDNCVWAPFKCIASSVIEFRLWTVLRIWGKAFQLLSMLLIQTFIPLWIIKKVFTCLGIPENSSVVPFAYNLVRGTTSDLNIISWHDRFPTSMIGSQIHGRGPFWQTQQYPTWPWPHGRLFWYQSSVSDRTF